MTLKFLGANAVVLARQFNPSVFSQIWLVNTGVLTAADFGEESAFTNMFVQVVTKEFNLLVVPDRLQLVPRMDESGQQKFLVEKIGKVAEALPHTPFVAVGLNFSYHLIPDHVDVRDLTRQLFFVKDSPLHQDFDTSDARFGGYLSKDVAGCRMKLEVKPAFGPMEGLTTTAENPEGKNLVSMEFNFHRDIESGPNAAKEVISTIQKWDEARALASRSALSVAERDKP